MADLFRLMARLRSDTSHSKAQKKKAFTAATSKASPVVLKDCGLDMMKKG